jgi:hypothetical protein
MRFLLQMNESDSVNQEKWINQFIKTIKKVIDLVNLVELIFQIENLL